jgi:peptidoglycan/xylan/chitin deacetylase (PgdA/CDA1 family)
MKRYILSVGWLLGIPALFRRLYRNRILVLMYHGVAPDHDTQVQGDWLQVRASEFRAQMTYLACHYEVCNFSRVLTGGPSKRPLAIVTFDDGYANNCSTALPTLAEFGLPATVFVTTGMVDSQRMFWWDRLRLSLISKRAPTSEEIDQIKSLHPTAIDASVNAILDSAGCAHAPPPTESYRALDSSEIANLLRSGLIEIGSHTHRHEILIRLNDNEVKETLDASARCLRRWGANPRWFAAPNGDFRENQVPIIQSAGFEICVGTNTGLWDAGGQKFSIPRVGVGRGLTLAEFAFATSGAADWARSLLPQCIKDR